MKCMAPLPCTIWIAQGPIQIEEVRGRPSANMFIFSSPCSKLQAPYLADTQQ